VLLNSKFECGEVDDFNISEALPFDAMYQYIVGIVSSILERNERLKQKKLRVRFVNYFGCNFEGIIWAQ
jgi:hypothetical protein